MLIDRVSVKNASGSWIHTPATEKLTRVLIPVSFSDLSYNALAYALKLVKAFNGVIDLLHVVDLDEIVESDNPVVVNRWLVKREREAASRIQSLREIIGESHVSVSSSVVVTGNKRLCLLNQIREVRPDLIVLGKTSKVDNLVTFISKNSSCPVLVVPSSPTLGLPSRIALATDKNPVTETSLSSFFKIVQHTTRSFSIVNIQKKKCAVREGTREIRVDGHDVKVNHIENESLDSYAIENEVDLLCAIQRKQSFLKGLFQRHYPLESVGHLNIPVLIVSDGARRRY